MKIYNEKFEMKSSLTENLIYEPKCGICDYKGNIQHFIDFNIYKCYSTQSNLFTLLQLYVMKEKNIPVNLINEAIFSDKNGFTMLLNCIVNQNLYYLNIGGRIGRNEEFGDFFECVLNLDEKNLVKKIVKSLDQKFKDGKLYRAKE